MKLHLPSVLAALGIVSLVAFLSSQGGALIASAFRIEFMPHPRDYMQIKESAPFTVPAGKIFVATALGQYDASGPTPVSLAVDELTTFLVNVNSNADSRGMVDIPHGFTAHAGSVVEPFDALPNVQRGVVWGYLANE